MIGTRFATDGWPVPRGHGGAQGRLLGWIALALVFAGCAGSRPYTLGPIKTFDPDNRPVEMPAETEQNQYWDRVDLTLFHQLEKPLDLTWTGRELGQTLGVAGEKQADNVNVLDEPPNSSWYTRRHYYQPMTREELARGPNPPDGPAGPDTSRPWLITEGKSVGAASGFFIKDARGDRFLIKLDKPAYPELASSAEVIATKILYAAGYYVPQNTITYFHPDQLRIAEDATVEESGTERPLRREDLTQILKGQPRTPEGTIRALASKFVTGRPLGPWNFRGTRADDPNDRVRHEHRRELRGLRVIGSWLNDTDRRAANTLAVYTDARYVKHYLIDMSSTLGANTGLPHLPIHGQAYMIDPRYMARALVRLGLYQFPWWDIDPAIPYPSVGYFRADVFDPGGWVPTYPNPAFEKLTLRDAFWGAKIVMAFTDADLRAIVETAQMSNPAAEAYLLDVLQRRRDKVGRYWFARIAPLDRFRVTPPEDARTAQAASVAAGAAMLRFDDLAVTSGLEAAASASYTYAISHDDVVLAAAASSERPALPLMTAEGESIGAYLTRQGATRAAERVVQVEVRVVRPSGQRSKPVRVFVPFPADGTLPRVVGVQREE